MDKMLVFSHCSLRKVFETLQGCSTLEALQVHACSDDFDAFKVPGGFEKKMTAMSSSFECESSKCLYFSLFL